MRLLRDQASRRAGHIGGGCRDSRLHADPGVAIGAGRTNRAAWPFRRCTGPGPANRFRQRPATGWPWRRSAAGTHRGGILAFDIGSTTTDIVPLVDGQPVPEASALDRLRLGELVYTGVRQGACARALSGQGSGRTICHHTRCLSRIGRMPEDESDCSTADGRPATRTYAHARLARMLCADGETCFRGTDTATGPGS